MLLIALLSLVAGALTVLAPCVLPFLPIIVGGSLKGGSRARPFLVAGSLIASLFAFTLLLKATTLLIHIDPRVWSYLSGGLVIILGIMMLIPGLWAGLMERTRLGNKSHELLHNAQKEKGGTLSAILTGAALGPVFSSCSPTYAWVIATVLPAKPAVGLFYLVMYCIGLVSVLLAVSLLGRALVTKLGWAANPSGWFQRALAVLFIIVGLIVFTGTDKKIEAKIVDTFPGLYQIEQTLLPVGSPNSGASDKASADPNDFSVPAPELVGLTDWINSKPLTLEELRGKVVLIDFWTYSCINCIRTQPYLNSWYDTYHDKGLVIIGVHAPEFAFEKVPANVQRAVKEENIKYPVALDNDFETWRAYRNQYWPAKYLIDKNGNVRFAHFGEGGYSEMEQKIKDLLGDKGSQLAKPKQVEQATPGQSPETYLGTKRADPSQFQSQPALTDGEHTFKQADSLPVNGWSLNGDWRVDEEKATALQDGATLTYRFNGKQLFLVLGPEAEAGANPKERVSVEGKDNAGGDDVRDGTVQIDSHRLYRLVRLPEPEVGTLVTITFDKGVSANAFTFG
ncbi:cytochrome c biogenesis protein DipZ [Dermabacteraceae bacterium P13101]